MIEWEIRCGDALEVLRGLPGCVARCCVTSPPYWGLRDYGVDGQLGLEGTPEEYVERLVEVFREVHRVLTDDGMLWLNLGDSYAGARGQASRGRPPSQSSTLEGNGHRGGGPKLRSMTVSRRRDLAIPRSDVAVSGLKPKDLVGIPWRVAFALQEDGWWLRSEIIWHKPNPMPESVRDRPTKAHEQVFLLSKSARYYYDAEAIAEPASNRAPGNGPDNKHEAAYRAGDERLRTRANLSRIGARANRNARSVRTMSTKPFPEAHFATFPPELPERCIKAASAEGDLVLDPFSGAGTTGLMALRLGRRYLGIEMNPEYVAMSERRIVEDAPLLRSRRRPLAVLA